MRVQHRLLVALLALAVLSLIPPTAAQGEITVSLAVPTLIRDLVEDTIVQQFEAENPGVRLHLVFTDDSPALSPGGDITEYLDAMQTYVSQADVFAITNGQVTPESVRAGYFLDMNPLISTDASFGENDFYTTLWQSYRWDNGTWAVPVSADVLALYYDPAAFDEAGVPYPTDRWTFADFEDALRRLALYNQDGSVQRPALIDLTGDRGPLLLSLLGDTVVDSAFVPAIPRYNNPALAALLEDWVRLENDGLFTAGEGIDTDALLSAPMIFGRTVFANLGDGSITREMALLPGGRAGLLVNGAAISSGTRYPEAAYALVKFITNSPELANAFFGVIPARQSLIGAEVEGPQFFFADLPESYQPIVDAAALSAFPVAEVRFSGDLETVINRMVTQGLDATTALQEVENDILERLDLADQRREDVRIVVAEPPPPAQLNPGEVVLDFGIQSFFPQLPNQDRWDRVASDFASSDPQVGEVVIDTRQPFTGGGLDTMAEAYDCFYIPNNVVPNIDLTLIRSMSPLMAADPSFDPNDFAGGVLTQVQRDNQVWAFPLTIAPQVLWYNPDIFRQTGAALPFPGWTVSDFELSLRDLRLGPNDPPPFESRDFDSSHLLTLIAAYGGLPLDYRTAPPTINFTDPATVDAIRQVLDLARDGYLNYARLSGGFNINFQGTDDIAMYSQLLNDIAFFIQAFTGDDEGSGGYLLTSFPQGAQYNAISYDIGTAYISASSDSVEACYRFISSLSQTPDLFDGMPARRSMINSPELALAQGDDAVGFYNSLDTQMSAPNTILIPSLFQAVNDLTAGASNFIIVNWLNRAFDTYVLDDGDLETALAEAELLANNYQQCIVLIPPYDPLLEDQISYVQRYADCAIQVDPTVEGLFGGPN